MVIVQDKWDARPGSFTIRYIRMENKIIFAFEMK